MLHFRMNMPFSYMALYGSVMILAVLFLRFLLKERMPKFVFPVLWGVVLLRLLVPFSISSPLSLPVPSAPFMSDLFSDQVFFSETAAYAATDTAIGQAALGGAEASVEAVAEENVMAGNGSAVPQFQNVGYGTRSLRNVLPALYLLGLAATAGVLGWQKYSYAKKLKGSLLMEHNETVNSLLRELDMGHVLVFTNDEIASPMVCGLLAPKIYFPTRIDFQNTVLLRHILAHETMHIRRRDNWMKNIMLLTLVMNWYNPLVWVMAKCLASDLEAACDAGVLERCDEEGRKSYAYSLLAMAITGGRSTLLYSAFSRSEVEKRVKGIVHYRKATVITLLFSLLFLLGSTAVFASGGQAPFSSYLAPYCASSNSRWGVKARIARDISLGENAGERAMEAIFSVLREDTSGDPDILEREIKAALAEAFGVEKRAFFVELNLCLDEDEIAAEYAQWGIEKGKDGFWLYEGKQIRNYEDKMLGAFQSREKGETDISVQRDRLGNIISVEVWRRGDREYDERTWKTEQGKTGGGKDMTLETQESE